MEVNLGIPDELREPVIVLFYEAFKRKFSKLMTMEEALRILPGLLNLEQIVFASTDGRLVGFAGIQHGKKHLFKLSLLPFIKCLGLPRGLFVAFILLLFGRPYREDELLMDGICVDKSMRGQGIGSLLLNYVFTFAQHSRYKTIRLDVVDTNPDARRPYERMGFCPAYTRYHPFAKWLLGFSSSTAMIKRL